MTLIREMQDSKLGEKRTKCGVWLLLLKRGSCLCQTTRADQPERSKSISTFCLGKMLFLSHSKKQVRFDFTTKILHVTQVFGEIHDSNAPVSRTFILYMVSLRLSFLFCCRISLHHHRSTSDPSPEISSLINIDFSDCATIEWNHRRLSF